MTADIFTRDTLLDISVNVIPLFIMGFFLALFLVVAPWGGELTLARGIQVALVVSPLVGLTILTYVAAKHIEG